MNHSGFVPRRAPAALEGIRADCEGSPFGSRGLLEGANGCSVRVRSTPPQTSPDRPAVGESFFEESPLADRSDVSHASAAEERFERSPGSWPTAIEQMEAFRASCPPLRSDLNGRGVVTSCGADRVEYLLNAYVQFRLIRELGCELPIDCWYAGAAERCDAFAELVRPLGVVCRDAVAAGFVGHPIRKHVPFRSHAYEPAQLHGYSLKPFAILASSFAEVVWFDADCHPIVRPDAAFEQEPLAASGALVWADDPRATYHYPKLEPFGLTIPPGEENGWETGQMVLDKRRHWRSLQLANWFCATADHWFQHVWGAKDALFAAWLKEQAPYWRGSPEFFEGRCFLHRLPDGRPFVLHRAGEGAKLRLGTPDPLERPPQRATIDAAVREFARWHMRTASKRSLVA